MHNLFSETISIVVDIASLYACCICIFVVVASTSRHYYLCARCVYECVGMNCTFGFYFVWHLELVPSRPGLQHCRHRIVPCVLRGIAFFFSSSTTPEIKLRHYTQEQINFYGCCMPLLLLLPLFADVGREKGTFLFFMTWHISSDDHRIGLCVKACGVRLFGTRMAWQCVWENYDCQEVNELRILSYWCIGQEFDIGYLGPSSHRHLKRNGIVCVSYKPFGLSVVERATWDFYFNPNQIIIYGLASGSWNQLIQIHRRHTLRFWYHNYCIHETADGSCISSHALTFYDGKIIVLRNRGNGI